MSHILHLLAASSLAMTIAACSSHADESSQNIFDGKTFSVLGDSYSTFVGAVTPDTNYVWYTPQELEHNCTDVDSVSQIWWSIVADSLHMNLLQNNSFSGATVCNRGYNGDDYSDRSFITRQDNLPTSDYIFIFGGTNDSWAGAPVGTYDFDCFDADSLYTFRPAMALLLSRLKAAQPNAQIFVLINSQLRSEITESLIPSPTITTLPTLLSTTLPSSAVTQQRKVSKPLPTSSSARSIALRVCIMLTTTNL